MFKLNHLILRMYNHFFILSKFYIFTYFEINYRLYKKLYSEYNKITIMKNNSTRICIKILLTYKKNFNKINIFYSNKNNVKNKFFKKTL